MRQKDLIPFKPEALLGLILMRDKKLISPALEELALDVLKYVLPQQRNNGNFSNADKAAIVLRYLGIYNPEIAYYDNMLHYENDENEETARQLTIAVKRLTSSIESGKFYAKKLEPLFFDFYQKKMGISEQPETVKTDNNLSSIPDFNLTKYDLRALPSQDPNVDITLAIAKSTACDGKSA